MTSSSIRTLLAAFMALVAPMAFYSIEKFKLPLPDDLTPVRPCVRRLQAYLRIRTDHGSPDYESCTQFLNQTVSTLLPSASFHSYQFVPKKHVVLIRVVGTSPHLPSILLNSHTDVVPAEPDKWTFPPFDARLVAVDGQVRVYARGAQDMKSVGMQYLEALSNLLALGWRPTRTIYISFVPDEEIGGVSGMGELTKSSVFSSMNVGVALDEGLPHPDAHFNVYYSERRVWWLTIKVAGNPGHGATLPGHTAADTLQSIVARAMEFRRKQYVALQAGKDLGDVINVNLAFFKAGTKDDRMETGYVMNVISSEAEAGFDLRVPPSVTEKEMDAFIKEWLICDDGNICPGASYRYVHKVPESSVTSREPERNPYIVPFADATKKAGVADRIQHGVFFASSDARYLRERGIPVFGFSPIEKHHKLLHKHDEYLSVESYLHGIQIYEHVIKELADFDPQPVSTDVDINSTHDKVASEMVTQDKLKRNESMNDDMLMDTAPENVMVKGSVGETIGMADAAIGQLSRKDDL